MFPVFWAWHCVFHAPVCCYHRYSLTRWRLALAQEAARGASSSSSLLFFWTAMCLLISDSLRGMSLQEKWTYEGPASQVMLLFTHCATYMLPHSQFSIEALEKCTLKDWWRAIRTNFLKRDSLVCDFSYTCAVTFKPSHRLAGVLLCL